MFFHKFKIVRMKRKAESTKLGGNTVPPTKKAKKVEIQDRHWTFTNFALDTKWNPDVMQYLVWQYERCKTGRKHQQCYVIFKTKRTRTGAQKLLSNEKIHIEQSRGDATANTKYCTKLFNDDGTPARWDMGAAPNIHGKIGVQGERNDITQFVNAVMDGANEYKVMTEHVGPWAKYPALYNRVKFVKYKYIDKPAPFVWVLCGAPGTGKSKIAHLVGDYIGSYFTFEGDLNWLDGYDNETCLIIEEFDGQMKREMLNTLLDRYKARRPVKGAFTWITSPLIFITTNKKEWMKGDGIKRRLDVVSFL